MGDFEALCTLPFSEPQSFYVLCPERRGGLCSRVRLGPILPRRLPRRPGAGAATGRVVLLRTVLGAVASGSVNWNRRAGGALLMQQWVLPGTLWVPSTPEQSPSQQASCPFVPGSLYKHTRSSPVASQTPWGSELWS